MAKIYNFLIIESFEKSIMHSLSNQINILSYPRKLVSSIFNRMQHTRRWIPACAGMTSIIDCLIQDILLIRVFRRSLLIGGHGVNPRIDI